ncbi:ATP-dependent DNA helicase RecG [Azotosporobacter soli]|uniref:ATP-dependent DNA helicase RecG n=1 Tax=Azotosporobacter soli TaxID=3055040 RepID=UPI0031FE8B4B
MNSVLDKGIQYLKGVGPAKAAMLSKLGLFSVRDLLEHFPKRYEDGSKWTSIAELQDGLLASFKCRVTGVQEQKPRRGLSILKVAVSDGTGQCFLVWFNQGYRKQAYKVGQTIVVAGKVKRQRFQPEITNPEVEDFEAAEWASVGKIMPVYGMTEPLNQRFFRTLIEQALELFAMLQMQEEALPLAIKEKYDLMDWHTALQQVHFPSSQTELAAARKRLIFEELYWMQCWVLAARTKCRSLPGIKHGPQGALERRVLEALPFALTQDQKQVWQEIRADMEELAAMQRLLQGDVGSGKTVLAALALAKTVENGYQGALMVPTEILAEQHYLTMQELLGRHGVKVALLTGRLKDKEKAALLTAIRQGDIQVTIGTHALIQDGVEFEKLGLAITDEQHRFGVFQRAKLQEKGRLPDMLVMTATPIPRTMALTVYGDLEVSAIRELPPGRKPVKTYVRNRQSREKVYLFIRDQVAKGRQAYVVCPLVEESDKIEAQAAVELHEELSGGYLQGIACGLVHGRLKSSERDVVMDAFYAGEIKVLVSTTVIEVGVNVPNAAVMVIECAERFGLAQLHQLRGRIGRGAHQSYCVLLSEKPSPEGRARLEIMASVADGFLLAEEDLKLRGPGQFFGARQHGLPDLKIADVFRDGEILLEARSAAKSSLEKKTSRERIERVLEARFAGVGDLIFNA